MILLRQETVDLFVHEGDQDFAVRMTSNPLDEGERSVRKPKWIKKRECRDEVLPLLIDLIENRIHRVIALAVNKLNMDVAR